MSRTGTPRPIKILEEATARQYTWQNQSSRNKINLTDVLNEFSYLRQYGYQLSSYDTNRTTTVTFESWGKNEMVSWSYGNCSADCQEARCSLSSPATLQLMRTSPSGKQHLCVMAWDRISIGCGWPSSWMVYQLGLQCSGLMQKWKEILNAPSMFKSCMVKRNVLSSPDLQNCWHPYQRLFWEGRQDSRFCADSAFGQLPPFSISSRR